MPNDYTAASSTTAFSEPRLPGGFPTLPDEVIARFPSLSEYNGEVAKFWRRVRSSITDSAEEFTRASNDTTDNLNNIVARLDNGDIASALQNLSAAVGVDGATSTYILDLQAKVGSPSDDPDSAGTLFARYKAENEARATADDALASQIEDLTAAYQTADTALQAQVTTITTTYATKTYAEARRDEAITAAATYTDGQVSGLSASIATSYATKVYADGTAEARKTEAITAAGTYTNGQISSLSASIATTYATKTYADGTAEARKTEAISAAAADAASKVSIETAARIAADGSIHARWGVAIDVNGNVVGRINLDGSNQTSEFSVVADKFTVWNGTSKVPVFQVVSGAVRISGGLTLLAADVSGLGTLATQSSVSTAQVTGLAATATSSDYSAVTGTKPPSNADVTLSAINGDLNVTGGGMILTGGRIRSGGYIAGSAGWIINSDGSAEFSDVLVRGTIESEDGTIGGFTIGPNSLTAGTGSTYFELQNAAGAGLKLGTTSSTPGYFGNEDEGFAVEGGTAAIFASRAGNFSLSLNRNTSDGPVAIFHRSASQVGSIAVTTTATSYNTSSDVRLKTNIRDLVDVGPMIDAMQPRIFDWKTGEKGTIGFVAQELFGVFPQAVTRGDSLEKIGSQWAIDKSHLVPILVAEIKSLRRRVEALEM